MEDIFIKILNMSITASYFVVALILLRAVFRKIPKWLSCTLWGLVGLRLVLPFSFNSILSLIPSAETVPSGIMYAESPYITSGIGIIDGAAQHILYRTMAPNPGDSANPLQIITAIAAFLWIAGIAAMLIYTLLSFLLVRRKTKLSIKTRDGYYICDSIGSPFILGIIRPKIFIPSSVLPEDIELILSHEKAHIKRLDHIWKPLGFLLLSVYWFNPLMWLAYVFLCRDIEAACDEKVLKSKGLSVKKSYSEALINCSAQRRLITACPLAFGETDVKSRIKGILSYKKPTIWLIIIALIVSIVLSVCFMTNPDGMRIDDIPGYENIFKDVDKLQFFTGENRVYTTMDTAEELRGLKKAKIAEAGEVWYDYAYKIEINDRFLICIDNEFTLFTVMDNLYLNKVTANTTASSETPIPTSRTYGFKNPEVFKDFFLDVTDNTAIINQDDIDGFTHYSGIYVTLDSITFGADNLVSFNITWHNETTKTVNFGEMFRIELIDGTDYIDITPKDATWHTIAYILKPESTLSHTYSVIDLNISQNATYRFSTSFSIEDGRNYSGDCGFSFNNTYASSTDGTSTIKISKELTLDDVIRLSEKGTELTWSDFENYSFIETGSGLYIRAYKIDERFSLTIGGSGTDSEPMYIYLCAPDGSAGKFIDIRQDDVEQFIEENKDNPIPAEGYLTFSKWLFQVDTTGDNLNKVVQFGSFLPVNYNRIKTYPTIKIDSVAQLNEFCDYFKDTMDFNALSDYTGISFSQFKDAWFFENSSYFEENTLLLIYVTAPNKLNSFDVDFLQVYDDTLHINIREGIYETDDNTTTGWLIAIETSKGYTEDIKHINAYVSSTVNLPEPQITHFYIQKSGNKVYGSSFELYDNGTFMLPVSPYSSFLEIGTFEYQGDLLILTSDDNERRYVFEVNSDSVTFKRVESVVHSFFTEEEVPDGARFMLQ